MFITFFISAFKFHVMIVKLNVYFHHSNSYTIHLHPMLNLVALCVYNLYSKLLGQSGLNDNAEQYCDPEGKYLCCRSWPYWQYIDQHTRL